jgi:hypothetical protein
MYGRCTSPPESGFKKERGECRVGFHESVSLVCDHVLAILVNQGSNPKVPYQALCDPRERQAFLRVGPLGTKGVLVSRTCRGGGLLP